MIIRDDLRPTMIRTNSRYRGITEREKYSNYVGETIHDLRLLGKVMFGDELIEAYGHEFNIKDNLASYITGEGTHTKSNIASATTLYGTTEHIEVSGGKLADLIPSATWVAYGGCTKTQTPTGISLASDGAFGVSGIGTSLNVEEGQIIYIRMAVKNVGSVPVEHFALGSEDINQGQGDITKYKIPQNGSTIYIDKRLYCTHREPVTLSIDVQNLPDVLSTPHVEISEVEIKYMTENKMTLGSLDGVIKPKINLLESKVENIIKNL
jgi:hypothetical protein